MYDILWDDVFGRFYIPSQKDLPDLIEDDLPEEDDSFDRWLMGLAGIL